MVTIESRVEINILFLVFVLIAPQMLVKLFKQFYRKKKDYQNF